MKSVADRIDEHGHVAGRVVAQLGNAQVRCHSQNLLTHLVEEPAGDVAFAVVLAFEIAVVIVNQPRHAAVGIGDLDDAIEPRISIGCRDAVVSLGQ